ncbi:hypothetical protein PAMP_007196 [Pampus punctatissimus]
MRNSCTLTHIHPHSSWSTEQQHCLRERQRRLWGSGLCPERMMLSTTILASDHTISGQHLIDNLSFLAAGDDIIKQWVWCITSSQWYPQCGQCVTGCHKSEVQSRYFQVLSKARETDTITCEDGEKREVKMCERGGGVGEGGEPGDKKKEADVNIFMGNGLLDAGEKDNCLEYSFQVPAQFQALHLSEWKTPSLLTLLHTIIVSASSSPHLTLFPYVIMFLLFLSCYEVTLTNLNHLKTQSVRAQNMEALEKGPELGLFLQIRTAASVPDRSLTRTEILRQDRWCQGGVTKQ